MNTIIPSQHKNKTIKAKTSTDTLQIETIDVKLEGGFGKGLTTEIDAYVGKKLVVSREGHSLVNPFLGYLYTQMLGRAGSKNSSDGLIMKHWYPSSTTYFTTNITACTNASPAQITVVTTDLLYSLFGLVGGAIFGATGTTSINGRAVYFKLNGTSGSNRFYQLYSDRALTVPIDTSLDGAYAGGGVIVSFSENQADTAWNSQFGLATIMLGLYDGAVDINDWAAFIPIKNGTGTNQMVFGTVSYSPPAIDNVNDIGHIQLTRTFVNNSGSAITVKEIVLSATVGYYVYGQFGSDSGRRGVLARDVDSIIVPNGETLTINYRIKIASTSGGFIRQFLELLYRHVADASREAKDIDNANITAGRGNYTFHLAGGGGDHYPASSDSVANRKQPSWVKGILVGTGDTAVDIDNYDLAARVYHGRGAGQLVYYGTVVEEIAIVGQTMSFVVSALYENASGGAIEVKETGLACEGYRGTTTALLDDVHLITRNVLTPSVTIANGRACRVRYTVSITAA